MDSTEPLAISLMPMGGDVNIDIDASLFIQLGLFVTLMFLLTRLVFRPFLAGIDARNQKTVETRGEAKALEARATELEQRHKASLARARAEAAEVRQGLRVAALGAKEAEITGARQSADAVIEEARGRAASQFEAGRAQLLGEVESLSRLVVEKVIGRGI